MSKRQKKLTSEVMEQLRSKPDFMLLKIADVLWPAAVMRAPGHLDEAESPLLPDALALGQGQQQ